MDKGENWINGGFFIANPKILISLKMTRQFLRKAEKISKLGELKAFKHEGFWQCMDHKIDKIKLDELCLEKSSMAEMKRIIIFGGKDLSAITCAKRL